MKKIVKRISIGIGTLIVIIAIVLGGFYLKMKSELKKMNVTETKEVVQNVYAIKDSFVNMFLVKDNDNYVAIDAGNEVNVIAEELKKLNIDPGKISAVFLTHTDGDHVAALKLFKNATVYLAKEEEQMINGKTARMMAKHNVIDAKKYTLLDDQQKIEIGHIRIKGILTPGHTPGSMSFLINGKYLFVGDAFGLKDGKVEKPNKFFSKDIDTAIKSFDKINNLPGTEYIFTAHTGYTKDYTNAVKTLLK
jgi:hydroxyacylglutathione hydrolase